MAFSSNLTQTVPDLRAIRLSTTNRTYAGVAAVYRPSSSSKLTPRLNCAYRVTKSCNLTSQKIKNSLIVPELICGKSWLEKSTRPNMPDVLSAQNLVESLLNARDKLVIVEFYSMRCGGCRALHPKISQLAESNPDTVFLRVNYDELWKMCHHLRIHVLPFFKFYRGSDGCLCSFSCTNSTIKKFKDALAKHSTDRCSLGPPQGLNESELLNLASSGEILTPLPLEVEEFFLNKANPRMNVVEEKVVET